MCQTHSSRKTTVIHYSRGKQLLLLAGSLLFVFMGIFLVWVSPNQEKITSILVFLAGVFAVLIFGACAVFMFPKLLDRRPGLTITPSEIIDHSSGVACGTILWTDVCEISTAEIFGQSFIFIIVKNPEEYMDRQKNFLKRYFMKKNEKLCGTPLTISANMLKISNHELLQILTKYLVDENQQLLMQ